MQSQPAENGAWRLVSAHSPGRPAQPIGILLLDIARDDLYLKFTSDWIGISEEDDLGVWRELAQDMAQKARSWARVNSWIGWIRLLRIFSESARKRISRSSTSKRRWILYTTNIFPVGI
jgi:hypothetical protein